VEPGGCPGPIPGPKPFLALTPAAAGRWRHENKRTSRGSRRRVIRLPCVADAEMRDTQGLIYISKRAAVAAIRAMPAATADPPPLF
jgi:hypothetical protein